MPPSESLPRPPIAYYLLDSYGTQPRSHPTPLPPAQDELQTMLISLNALANSATKRARIAGEAARIGREVLARSAFGWKLDEGKRGKARDEDDKVGVLKKAGGAGYPRSAVPDPRRKDALANGMPKVKRELSASPAPTSASASEYVRPSSSRLGTPVDSERGGNLKNKKRKIAHLASPEADAARGRAESATREGSLGLVDRLGVQASATPGGTPGVERAASAQQQIPSGLKVKLNLSSSGKNRSSLPPADNGTSPSHRHPAISPNTSESAVQQLVNFALPAPTTLQSAYESLVPVRPPIPHPPKPLPKRQKDVNQDFSTVKHVTQNVQWTTFWNGVEPYLKDFGEEELAMLGFRPEDVEPFLIPPLGRHYQDIWDEEDSALPFASSSSTGPPAINAWDLALGGKHARQVPSGVLSLERTYIPVTEMVEEDLWDEAKGLGGHNERAVAAMLKINDPAFKKPPQQQVGVAAPLDGKTALPPTTPKGKLPELQVNGDALSPPPAAPLHTPSRGRDTAIKGKWRAEEGDEQVVVGWPIRPHRISSPPKRANERERAATLDVEMGQLEEGVAREMRLLGLLDADETVDWSLREDDEISCALRSCQRLLKTQVAVNNARKDRLLQVTKERLAYSEYKKVLDGLEKLIEQAWTKRYAALKKAGKKQKGKAKENANASASADAGPTSTALTPSKRREGVPPLSDQVKLAMSARRRWLDTVGHALENDPVVGRYRGLPIMSIYEGIDEKGREVRPLREREDADGRERERLEGADD